MAIGGQHALAAGKRAHQHQQARLRQVEVREQRTHQAEFKARRDEYLCLAGVGLEFIPPAALPRAADSSVRTTVVPTATMRRPSRTARFIASAAVCRQRVALAMQANFVRRVSTRSGAKVPRPTCSVTRAISTPFAANVFSICVGEVQACRGRGH